MRRDFFFKVDKDEENLEDKLKSPYYSKTSSKLDNA